MSGTPTPSLQQMEETPKHAETEVVDFREGSQYEDIGEAAGQDMAEGDGTGMQTVGSPVRKVKIESPEYIFEDDLPTTASFNEALGRSLGEMVPENLQAAEDAPVPSSVLEGQELHLGPALMALANDLSRASPAMQTEDPVGEGEMGGVESGDPEGSSTEDVEYTTDRE